MHPDEPISSEAGALSPEEIGARVSAILEAAERDARAVIDAAHREAAARELEPITLEELARELDALTARVEAIERTLATAPPADAGDGDPVAAEGRPPHERRGRRATSVDPAARVRAIELALAGYSREAIARELAASMPPAAVEGLLDEVLTR